MASSKKRFRAVIVVGTRPELIRLSRVIALFSEHTDLTLVHTGQNYDYGLNEVFFSDLGIKPPDHYLAAAGGNAVETMAQVLTKTDPILADTRPDAFLVLGDTNSCLAAIAAKRRRIPVFHMEAGNRSFDERVPEEINRRIVDHVSDVNLTYSEHARRYLLREGFAPDRVIKTGSPMFEVLTHYRSSIDASDVLQRLGLERRRYILVSAHREENVDQPVYLSALFSVLESLAAAHRVPVVVSTHPRTRKRLQAAGLRVGEAVRLCEPFGFLDYIKLQESAHVVLSDSGTITEESAILGFPAINIRESHERPEGMDEAAVPMAGLNRERIEQFVDLVSHDGKQRFLTPPDYQIPNVSEKVLRIVLSYTDYVRRTVWQESGPTFSR